jgi:ligand-binding sensor domain-containing protein
MPRMISKFIGFIFLLTAFSPLLGQIYPHRSYSVREGLVNSSVYSIAQDSSGYIWFGTESGLSRFNGREFKNFTLDSLKFSSMISSVVTGLNGHLYLGSGSNGILEMNPSRREFRLRNFHLAAQSSQIVHSDTILISLHEYHDLTFLSAINGKPVSEDQVSKEEKENKPLVLQKLKNGRVLVGRLKGLYEITGTREVPLEIPGLNNRPVYSIFETMDGSWLLGTDGHILTVKNRMISEERKVLEGSEQRIRNIVIDALGNTWFNPWGTPELFMTHGTEIVNVSSLIPGWNTIISRIIKDREGNIWVGTLGKGVFLFTNNHLMVYPGSKDFINPSLRKIKELHTGSLLIGTQDGLAVLQSDNLRIHSLKHIPHMTQYVRDLALVGPGEYVAAITDIRLTDPLRNSYFISPGNEKIRYAHGSSLARWNNYLWVGNWDNTLLKYRLPGYENEGMIKDIFPDSLGRLRINSLYVDRFDRMWIGGQKGLCIMRSSGEKYFLPGIISEMKINNISENDDGSILVSASGGFIVLGNHKDFKQITLLQTVHIPNTTRVIWLNHKEYLAGTTNGLIYHHRGVERLLSVYDGMLSENISDLWISDSGENIWVATSEGLVRVDLPLLRKSMNEKLTVNSLRVIHSGETITYNGERMEFPFSSQAIRLSFEVFHYQNPQLVQVEYRHNQSEWQKVSGYDLQFPSLAPGTHKLEFRASLYQGLWGTPLQVDIEIIPPYYRTTWFYLLSTLMAITLIWLFFRQQFRQMKKRQEEQAQIREKITELQQKALASNLNPHFVFNSLNSIQHFINANNKAEANDYLAKFSRLMRMHLNMADKGYISLHEEISRLEFYLTLEEMRFGDKLKWEIKIDPGVDVYQTEIPNMIIQPFVENAVWHGIMPSTQNNGRVEVNIRLTDSGDLNITITDNGVGMKLQVTANKSGHVSKGVQLIRDRLKLLDPRSNEFLIFEPLEPGTKVTIRLTRKMFRKPRLLEADSGE